MREIKFRGKPVYRVGKAISWVYGTFKYIPCNVISPGLTDNGRRELRHDKGIIIEPLYCSEFEVICDTVSQFTGIHDKNGKEIYEGDILQLVVTNVVDKSVSKPKIRKVIWKDCGFEIVDKYNSCICDKVVSSDVLEYTVIGNIYDNPELLTT